MQILKRSRLIIFLALPLVLELSTATPKRGVAVYREANLPTSFARRPLAELAENQQEIISKTWDYVEWQGTHGWIRRSLVLSAWHFENHAQLEKGSEIYDSPDWHLTTKTVVPESSPVTLLEIHEDWVKIASQSEINKGQGWVPIEKLKPTSTSWGNLYVTRQQPLYSKAHVASRPLATLPPGARLNIEQMEEAFAKVSYKDKTGYVPIAENLSKVQFARQIQDQDGRWQDVLFVVGEWVQTTNNTYVPFAKIRGLRVDPERLYVMSPQASLRQRPSLASPRLASLTRWLPLQRLDSVTIRWARSLDREKKNVWWALNGPDGTSEKLSDSARPQTKNAAPLTQTRSAPSLETQIKTDRPPLIAPKSNAKITPDLPGHPHPQNTKPIQPPSLLTSESLFRRRVFDIASSPVIPNLLFASANGIFRSLDGKNWEQRSEFGENNYPIAIAADGVIYIGPYRSTDHGQTFTNYVRWDHLLGAIQKVTRATSSQLRLKKIEVFSDQDKGLQLTLDTGHNEVTVFSPNGGKTWEPILNR